VEEGAALFGGVTTAELERLTKWLVDARELTDRHRDRIRG
jgi:hypothetical protein